MSLSSGQQGRWGRLMVLVFIGVITAPCWLTISYYTLDWTIESVTPRPLHPSYASLKAHGFYVFVLPQSEIERRGWKQWVRLWSWDIHCGLLRGDTTNPLVVYYTDQLAKKVFEIWHGPWGIVWNYGLPTVQSQVESHLAWNTTGTLTYYTQTRADGSSRHLYRFEDMAGYPVEISSQLSITETLELIEQLEYVGPPSETVRDPWDCQ